MTEKDSTEKMFIVDEKFNVDDMVYVSGWGDSLCRVIAVTQYGDVVVEHPMGDADVVPPGWLRHA